MISLCIWLNSFMSRGFQLLYKVLLLIIQIHHALDPKGLNWVDSSDSDSRSLASVWVRQWEHLQQVRGRKEEFIPLVSTLWLLATNWMYSLSKSHSSFQVAFSPLCSLSFTLPLSLSFSCLSFSFSGFWQALLLYLIAPGLEVLTLPHCYQPWDMALPFVASLHPVYTFVDRFICEILLTK